MKLMRHINRLVALAGILALVTAGHADTILRQQSFDLTQVKNPSVFTLNNLTVSAIGTDNEGLTAVDAVFKGHYASIGHASSSSYQDWSPYNIIAVKLTNHESFPCTFRMLVYLTSSPTNGTNMFSGGITIGAGETRRFLCYLNPDDAMPFGMEYLRPVLSAPFVEVYSGGSFRNLKTIYNWRLSYQGTTAAHVDVSDLRLIKQNLVFDNMVDAFGQYTDRTWTNKINSTDDLQTQRAAEQTDLASNPGPGEQLGTTKITADNPVPGQWAVVTQNSGKKYLQHPNGNLFWALGVSAVRAGQQTPVGGRENMFTNLPDSAGQFSTCYSIKPTLDGNNTCYSFHQQNLMLKYGANYLQSWESVVWQRLASWGLNTLGMQCDSDFYNNSMPQTQILSTSTFGDRLRLPHQLWGTMPDPYDANFTPWMVTNFSKALAPYNGQKNFMGAYVDNELSWGNMTSDKLEYNIELGILKAASTQPAKVAFVNWLNKRYNGSISGLNSAWGKSFSSFNSILTGTWVPSTFPLPSGMENDFRAFSTQFANQYFSSVRNALTQIHMSGLYLGCRFAEYTPEAVQSCDSYTDVVTLNVYRTADNFDWNFFSTLKHPYMFSELGYSVEGDGTFAGCGVVYSQADRVRNLTAMLNMADTQANCVGAILYCYSDQMITGRYSDYENSGLGLVDVTDTPHYETVNVLRQFAQNMYTNRN
jgi:hypothetical protein